MIKTPELEVQILWEVCGIKDYAQLVTQRPLDAAKLTGMIIKEGTRDDGLKDGYHDDSREVLEEMYKLIPDLTTTEGRDYELATHAVNKLLAMHAVKHAETTIEKLFERERIVRQQAANEERNA